MPRTILPHGDFDNPPEVVGNSLSTEEGGFELVGASRIGRSHKREPDGVRQDAFGLALGDNPSSPWFTLVVADGMGAYTHSHVGSNAAVTGAIEHLCNLPAKWLRRHPETSLSIAASQGLDRLKEEARSRDLPDSELSCTFLMLLCTNVGHEMEVSTFQVGDGFIGAVRWDGSHEVLGHRLDEGSFSGSTVPFHGEEAQRTWEQRKTLYRCERLPDAFLVMTDGVSEDFYPPHERLPPLIERIQAVRDKEPAGQALAQLLDYEMDGSFDDRTASVAYVDDAVDGDVREGETPSGATGEG